MSLPLVSVLIPVYNSEMYIAETITSVLNQTWNNIEIVVVDDGSTDSSFTLAKAMESERVRVYKQTNKGACAARNFAFSVAKGEYIQYLDADDLLSSDKIEKQLQILSSSLPGTVATCVWGRFVNSVTEFKAEEKEINKNYDIPVNWLIDSWGGKGSAQTSVWLVPRFLIEAAGPWNEDLKINQDGEFFARVLLHAKAIKFCESVYVYYRSDNENSISKSNKSEAKAESLLSSFESYKKMILPSYDSIEIRKVLALNFCNFIYLYSPHYPHLIRRANINIKELNVRRVSSIGGSGFRTLAKFVGFSNAIKLRNLIKNGS
ncbi:glycosyltransferase family 2 protein [Pontibacter sp. 13R65]|uniref:glycosyltransferase family 2 protein n=1 Tax=Pontibacter sp. 13R65 TaxID=3127458 RepID=UPI00301CE676